MEVCDPYFTQNYQNAPPPTSNPVTPTGIQAIYTACRRLYPDQPNPLQVTAVVKYWLGGPDPLDYISMYANNGDPARGIPAHWHYVSFGLSNLHGDGRVHELTGAEGLSGFGFELTFRLKRENGETAPPTWPAALMQSLARYVFQSENTLCVGDHIPWHSSLDGSESRIQHILMTEDPQLTAITTSLGTVNFVQIIGVCQEELKATQHWNGQGVLELLKSKAGAGGPWMITDMRRGETVFEIDPQLQEQVDQGIEHDGSNLSGVTGHFTWDEVGESHRQKDDDEDDKENRCVGQERSYARALEKPHISSIESEQIKAALKNGLNSTRPLPPIKSESSDNCNELYSDHNKNSRKQSIDSTVSSEAPTELLRPRVLDAVHLKFNLEAGAVIPLALKGRLKHGRHFTFKSVVNDVAITLVPSTVIGSIADEEHPYAAHGPWLQVLLTDDFIDKLLEEFGDLADLEEIPAPKMYNWPERKLTIEILPDEL